MASHRARVAPVAGAVALLAGVIAPFQASNAAPLAIEATPVRAIAGKGALLFSGGLVLHSTNPDLAALSGLAVEDGRIIAVTDTGFVLRGQVERDGTGRPTGITNADLAPLPTVPGDGGAGKWTTDAEGITVSGPPGNRRAFVTLEQRPRLLSFALDGGGDARTEADVFPGEALSRSFGMEALTALPNGDLLAVTEGRDGDRARAFLFAGGDIAELSVAQRDGFYITGATVTPDGRNLLLLERHFAPARGARMRMRRVPLADVKAGAVLEGETLISLGRRDGIDNMEGIAAFEGPEGETRVAIVSDDNKWPLQRTLYLEFVLSDAPAK